MAQEIKIKRSNTSLSPSSLKEGELAYGYVTDEGKLSIGRPDTDSGTGADVDIVGGTKFVSDVNNATKDNTASTIVKRDASGNFSAGTITAALTGNASTATKLAATANIHGVAFDGSADIDLSEEIQDTVGAMFSSNDESGITVTYQDDDGTIDLTVGTLNQNTSGNAATATALESDITINSLTVNGGESITLDADDIAEAGNPTNKYFTDARADARVDALINHANHSGGISVTKDVASGELRLTGASQYGDSDARGALDIHADSTSNLGSSLAYDDATGKFTYTAPVTTSVRSAVIASVGTSGGTGYGSIGYNNATGALQYNVVTQNHIQSSIETTGLTGLDLSNSSSASNLTFEGVANSDSRTLTFSGGGNSNEFSLKTQANNRAGNEGNFTVLSTNATDATGYSGTNTIGIGQSAPTSVDIYDNRLHIGPNTQFNGNVTLDGTYLQGASSISLNGSATDTDTNLTFKEGLVSKFKLSHNHADDTLTIMEGGSTAVITIPNSDNANPNITIARTTDFTQDVTISGDLTVNGGTTTITSTELSVGDNEITLNSDHNDSTGAVEDCGIVVNRGKLTNDINTDRATANLYFNATSLEWQVQTPNAADGVGTNAATPILTVGNIETKSFTVDGGTF